MLVTSLHKAAIGFAAIGFYVASAWLLFRSTVAGNAESKPTENHKLVWLLAFFAAAAHVLMLIGSTFTSDGLNLSFFNALSVTAWLAVVLTLLLNIGRPVINLGLFLFPLAALALALSLLFSYQGQSAIEPATRWHVLISIVAYALLTLSTGQALLVSQQDKRLKSRRSGGLLHALPPLKVMEAVLFQLLVASFICLSLALITGFLYLDNLFEQRLVHKTTLSLVAWLLLAMLLFGHLYWGWRGQKAAGFTLGAFFCLLLGYFGSKFVIELLLQQPA